MESFSKAYKLFGQAVLGSRLLRLLRTLPVIPFVMLYNRWFGKDVAKKCYQPVNDDELRVARPMSDEVAAEAREAGLTYCGSYVATGMKGGGRLEVRLWLNDRRDALLVVGVVRAWWLPTFALVKRVIRPFSIMNSML